jgi:protein gp37
MNEIINSNCNPGTIKINQNTVRQEDNMAAWNPWRGCHKKSEGCANCYIHRADSRKGINTDIIYKTDEFYKPIEKDKKGNYKVKSGQTVFLCFNSDFLVEEADDWRKEVWEMIKLRSDLHFLFLTKRIERFRIGLPEEYGDGFDHVTVCATIENQARAKERLSIFKELPIKHKMITIQPMLEKINISDYLDDTIECVVVGGESGSNVRPLDYEWVLDIREQCIGKNVSFNFRQLGSVFIKDGNTYKISRQNLCAQARKADIDYTRI